MNDKFRRGLYRVAAAFGEHDIIFDLVANLTNNSDDLVADLIEALGDSDQKVKAAAAFSLGHLFYTFWPDEIDASPSIPALMKLIDHDDPRVRFESTRSVAVLQVGRISHLTDEQIVDLYVCCLESRDSLLKVEVASQLRVMGPPAIVALPALSRMLDDEVLLVRAAAIHSIDEIRLCQCPSF